MLFFKQSSTSVKGEVGGIWLAVHESYGLDVFVFIMDPHPGIRQN
jgi:hypothetical protein